MFDLDVRRWHRQTSPQISKTSVLPFSLNPDPDPNPDPVPLAEQANAPVLDAVFTAAVVAHASSQEAIHAQFSRMHACYIVSQVGRLGRQTRQTAR